MESAGILLLVGLAVAGIGLLITLIGWIWLVIIGFRTDGPLWGILNIFFQPITGIIFCVKYKTGWLQLAMLIIGNIIIAAGGVSIVLSGNM
jgi:hypothetical protein